MEKRAILHNKNVKKLVYSIFAMIVVCLCFAFSGEKALAADDDVVYIPNEQLKTEINEQLGVQDPTADITEGQMKKVKKILLDVTGGEEYVDVTGISYCTELTQLSIYSYTQQYKLSKEAIDEISKLNKVSDFFISNVDCEDYSFIEDWTEMTELSMQCCDITVLPDLSKCTKLVDLSIVQCSQLSDISSLSKVKSVQYLRLYTCRELKDISLVENMTSLKSLNVSSLGISKDKIDKIMKAVSSLVNIEDLRIDSEYITDKHISMLDKFNNLKYLDLTATSITNIDVLLKYRNSLEELILFRTKVDNQSVAVIEQLTNLKTINLRNTAVTDYSFINKLPYLTNESWRKNDHHTTDSKYHIPYFASEPYQFEIENTVKDANGNYIAPLESEFYDYNEKTHKITVFLESIFSGGTIKINYDIEMENNAGIKFYSKHTIDVGLVRFKECADIKTYVGSSATLYIGQYFLDCLKFQWYKDGKKIDGATSVSLNIYNAELSDAGKYTVEITSGDYILKSREINLEVAIDVELAIEYANGSNMPLLGEDIKLDVISSSNTGDYTYKIVVENVNTGKIKIIKDYSASTSATTQLTSGGTYMFIVYAKDSLGYESVVARKTVFVIEKLLDATYWVNDGNDSIVITLGEDVKFEVKATGGSETYGYLCNVYDVSMNDDIHMDWYMDELYYTWTPEHNGVYYAGFIVLDVVGDLIYSYDVDKFADVEYGTDEFIDVLEQEFIKITVVRAPGLYKADNGKWYYYVNDVIDKTYTGLAKNDNGWWYVKNGTIDFSYTGMAKNEKGWFYVKKGKVDLTYTGLAENQYGTWYMVNGKVASNVSGLTKVSKKWMYLVKGKVDTDYVGLAKNESGWWYVENGTVDFTYTGMAKNDYGWWYVKNGELDRTYTGLATNEHGTWYMVNGKVASNVSGLTKVSKKWMYLVKGKIDTDYVGLAKNESGWWYVKNGTVDFTYTGMAKNQYGWWYVTKGQLDRSFTGIASNQYGKWYIKNGAVEKTYTGTVKYNGVTYNIKNGKVV